MAKLKSPQVQIHEAAILVAILVFRKIQYASLGDMLIKVIHI